MGKNLQTPPVRLVRAFQERGQLSHPKQWHKVGQDLVYQDDRIRRMGQQNLLTQVLPVPELRRPSNPPTALHVHRPCLFAGFPASGLTFLLTPSLQSV
jgi:hypothetical protein